MTLPVMAEGEGEEVTEPLPEPTTETTDGVTGDAEQAAQMIIDYMEGVRQEEKQAEEEEKRAAEEAEAVRLAEQAEADRQAAEEAAKQEQAALEQAEEQEQLKSIQIEQDNLNATYTSNTNVIYGYAEKYKYYYSYDVPYTDGYYTRYDRYIYCWDGWPAFKLVGNKLQFSGDAVFVSALYNGNTSLQTVSESITIGGNRVNAYSNIEILAYPSIYQINKSAYKSDDEIIQVITMLCALCIGWMVTKRFIVDG